MLRHKLLNITSRDKDASSNSNSDFTVSLNNIKELQTARSVIIKQVSIPITMYNITAFNRTFSYKIATVLSSFSITVGQYNITTLISALQTAGSALGLAITQNAITNKLSFTTTTNIEYLTITQNAMADVLGIKTGSGADVASYTSGNIVDLGGVKNIYLESNIGEHNLIRSNKKTISILGVIPVKVSYGFTEHYISSHTEIDDVDNNSHGGRNHQQISIVLRDSNDNILDLNGHHVEIVLKVHF